MDFREKIKSRLATRKMKVPELSRLVEMNQQNIYKYLSGKCEMTAANLERIFDVLKIKIK